MRRKLRHRQRSRRHRSKRFYTRRQRGAGLPVPAGAIVAISSGGELGVPLLMTKEQAETLQESGGLED